jgi:hypothetical protein
MIDITALIQYRPRLKNEIARLDREINAMRREIGILQEGLNDREIAMQREIGILQEGLNDREIERADLLDQLGEDED